MPPSLASDSKRGVSTKEVVTITTITYVAWHLKTEPRLGSAGFPTLVVRFQLKYIPTKSRLVSNIDMACVVTVDRQYQ